MSNQIAKVLTVTALLGKVTFKEGVKTVAYGDERAILLGHEKEALPVKAGKKILKYAKLSVDGKRVEEAELNYYSAKPKHLLVVVRADYYPHVSGEGSGYGLIKAAERFHYIGYDMVFWLSIGDRLHVQSTSCPTQLLTLTEDGIVFGNLRDLETAKRDDLYPKEYSAYKFQGYEFHGVNILGKLKLKPLTVVKKTFLNSAVALGNRSGRCHFPIKKVGKYYALDKNRDEFILDSKNILVKHHAHCAPYVIGPNAKHSYAWMVADSRFGSYDSLAMLKPGDGMDIDTLFNERRFLVNIDGSLQVIGYKDFFQS